MLKNLLLLMKNNRAKIFPFAVSLYLYALYMRCIYYAYMDIIKHIDNDYYNYLSRKCLWLLANASICIDSAIIALLLAVLLLSFYLLYRRSHYFYAVIMAPVYVFLFVVVCTTIYWF